LSELSKSDEWETPEDLFKFLCNKYDVFPSLDVCAKYDPVTNHNNSKCLGYLPNSLDITWKPNPSVDSVWCNPPHSKTEEFVRKAQKEWRSNNINIIMIIPANSMCTNYSEECIKPSEAEWHPINRKWCKFLHEGKTLDMSRNGYFVVIWRKKN